ncbi:MAG: tetratricopeptide repeat protein [Paludibacter sp.]|nr:tetratricopeptide repeat protein [Paludibacter sp.]
MKKVIFITLCILSQVFAMAQWDTEQLLYNGKKALYNDYEYVLSIQYFNQIISLKPYLAEPYFYRSVAKINLGDYLGAEEDCNKALEINPFVPFTYFIRGFSKANQEKYKPAISDLNKALEFHPNDTTFLSYRLALKEEMKDDRGAIEDIDLLYKLQPQRYNLLYFKGTYLLHLKDTANAILNFEKLKELDNNNYLSWSTLGLISMIRNDKKAALEYYNQSISRKSTNFGDYINRGNINIQNKNFNQALNDFNTAVKLDSTEVLGYYNRALLLLYLGDENKALKDLGKTVQMDSSNYDARWKKAVLDQTLDHNYRQAIADYKIILQKYPYFIPAIQGTAESEEALGNSKRAYMLRKQINNIENNKEYFKQKSKENIAASNKVSLNTQDISNHNVKRKNKIFNEFDLNASDSLESISGKIQNKNVNVINEKNFAINNFVVNKFPRRTNLSRLDIDQINKLKIIPILLGITNNEVPLLADVIGVHFANIKMITDSLANKKNLVEKYLCRGVEFGLVKDYIGAINDFDKVIQISPNFILGYFCRANIRQKLFENERISSSEATKNKEFQLKNPDVLELKVDSYKFDVQMILHDYDKVIELSPDFSFAYFNKANILCTQKEFQTAIFNYTKSIEIDHDFAEAYFNRGLTYLFIGEDAKGLADLSKSGELGIYKAYNLIQRFKRQ